MKGSAHTNPPKCISAGMELTRKLKCTCPQVRASAAGKPKEVWKFDLLPKDGKFQIFGENRVRDPWHGQAPWLDGSLVGDYGMDIFAQSTTAEALQRNRKIELVHGTHLLEMG